jgi:Tol biopolymer transport system component
VVYRTTGWDCEPIFNEDNSRIIFVEDGNIQQMNFNGTGKVNLTMDGGERPVFLRDFSKIVYQRWGNPYIFEGWNGNYTEYVMNIWIMDADGSNQTKLTNFSFPFEPSVRDISPDNQRILFSCHQYGHAIESFIDYPWNVPNMHGLWEINVDGTGQRRILEGGYGAIEYSDDGERIAFYSGMYAHHNYLWTVDPDGNEITEISTRHEFSRYYGDIRFHPNGRNIFYTVHVADDHHEEMWITELDGSNQRLLITTKDLDFYDFRFINNGDSLIFLGYDQEIQEKQLWRLDILDDI